MDSSLLRPVHLVVCVFVLLLVAAAMENLWTPRLFDLVAPSGLQKDRRVNNNIGGLLPPRLEGDECISRLEHHLYYGHDEDDKPSEYFVSKVRAYEKMHRRCAKEADSFTQILSSNFSSTKWESNCRFVIWISYQGLGNKMLTIASAFLYALATNRVLLIDRGTDMPELFCEPFANTSWFVPVSFPHDHLHGLNMDSPNKLGRLIEANGASCAASSQVNALPSAVYVHLAQDANEFDVRFYCKKEQELLVQVPWLLIRADIYYIPHLYFMDSFRGEFQKMFPDQDKVFHYTARYLFHPSNSIWEKTKRFYHTYLADGDTLVGYQIRPVDTSEGMLDQYWQQSLDCGLGKGILPNITSTKHPLANSGSRRKTRKDQSSSATTNVLVVSLFQRYYDRLKDLYLQHPTWNQSTVVKVHFASHEDQRQTDDLEHDKKAVMEVYLLAMCDVLVTTSRSTYGYIAHGYGGIRPWTIRGAFEDTEVGTREPCFRMSTIDPCLLRGPFFNCDCRGGNGQLPQGVKPCQDAPWGIRIRAEPVS